MMLFSSMCKKEKNYRFTTKMSESLMMVTKSTSADGFVKFKRTGKEAHS